MTPPGNTQTPGMNDCVSARLTISTSSSRSECLPPRRRSMVVAAGRGVTGVSAIAETIAAAP